MTDEIVISLDELEAEIARRRPRKISHRIFRATRNIDGIRPRPKLCEISGCNSPAEVLDHCHSTGKFRGWLCRSCNQNLGRFRDNAEGLRAALEYLEKFESTLV